MEFIRVLKRQDLSLIRGMATVDEELSTYLNAGKQTFFRLLTGVTPSKEVCMPLYVGISLG